MKKLVLTAVFAAAFMTACSKDDEPKCEFCTSKLGNKFEICENDNGTYKVTAGGVTETITQEELEGFSPKQKVELACAFDSDPER